MSSKHFQKYRPFETVDLPDRTWPNRRIERAPRWCSVDLRDGNQALIEPMGLERKQRMYLALLDIGFKEIEVGFAAASQIDFEFIRHLVDSGSIPSDVTIQVLSQCREDQIRRTFEAIRGARRAVVHIYNSTSALQRRVVFGLDRAGITKIAVDAARLVRQLCASVPETDVVLEYSPESFTGTELDFAKDVCEAVMDAWQPTPERPIILNLPATVEMSTPSTYADRIEWFGRHVKSRESVVISVHPHNDRGCAVAAAELALMAGADRVEGTLFGNGERTGNVDVVTLALNMLTQGVDPQLEIHDINAIVRVVEHCNRLPVGPRHPYAGELVFTAFSGSHQDAIRKGLAAQQTNPTGAWEVPYLPMDPSDIGRTYEAVIRINSQSGKSGIGYVLETEYGYRLPKRLLLDFSPVVQRLTEEREAELTPPDILAAFSAEYVTLAGPFQVSAPYETKSHGSGRIQLKATLAFEGQSVDIEGHGNGVLEAFVSGLKTAMGVDVRIADYSEHSLSSGTNAQAVAYIELAGRDVRRCFGVGTHANTTTASLAAVISALNRMVKKGIDIGPELAGKTSVRIALENGAHGMNGGPPALSSALAVEK